MEVSVLGSVTCVRVLQPENKLAVNVLSSPDSNTTSRIGEPDQNEAVSVLTDPGIVMEVSPVLTNALLSVVSDAGKLILVNFPQSEKAFCAIVVNEDVSANVTSDRLPQPEHIF